jgi:putative colanic acid biosynthesis acetyltransferase WcaF
MSLPQTRLDTFNSSVGFNRGKPAYIFWAWYLTKCLFFATSVPWPSSLKVAILRAFGATIGSGVVIKPRVNIHFPWKLKLGDFTWLGEEVNILNFELVSVGSHTCISQQVFLCAGGHNYRDPAFSYRNATITIGNGVWLQARVFVCPGVSIGHESVAEVCSCIRHNIPKNIVCSGNPAVPRSFRWKD